MVTRKKKPSQFLDRQEKERVISAIRRAESKTSGEIRVALDYKARGGGMASAQKVFKKLGMAKTKYRNGVLIFLAVRDRSFVILGDKGIHEKLGQEFWKEAAEQMQSCFARDEFAPGLEAAIQKTGEALARHFPPEKSGPNEILDKIHEQR